MEDLLEKTLVLLAWLLLLHVDVAILVGAAPLSVPFVTLLLSLLTWSRRRRPPVA